MRNTKISPHDMSDGGQCSRMAQTPAKPVDKSKPITGPLTFAALFMQVEKISPQAAQTIDAWHRFANEPPAAVFVSFQQIDDIAYKRRLDLWQKLEEFFDTQLGSGTGEGAEGR